MLVAGVSNYLLLSPRSRTHHRRSGRLPEYPHQGGRHGLEGHPYHQMGRGLRGLNRNVHFTLVFGFLCNYVASARIKQIKRPS